MQRIRRFAVLPLGERNLASSAQYCYSVHKKGQGLIYTGPADASERADNAQREADANARPPGAEGGATSESATAHGRAGPPGSPPAERGQVFISYGRADAKGLADQLSVDLAARGYKVWQDVHQIRATQPCPPTAGLPSRDDASSVPALHVLLERWRHQKDEADPNFPWLRSLRPPPVHLGTAQKAVLRGHEEAVLSMSYSPDGARIASGSFDQTVRVWDARSGESLEVIRGHGDVGAIAASAARFPYRALAREQETIVEDAASGDVVARSSESLSDIFTDPSGRSWAGGVGSCLCLLRLEGGQR